MGSRHRPTTLALIRTPPPRPALERMGSANSAAAPSRRGRCSRDRQPLWQHPEKKTERAANTSIQSTNKPHILCAGDLPTFDDGDQQSNNKEAKSHEANPKRDSRDASDQHEQATNCTQNYPNSAERIGSVQAPWFQNCPTVRSPVPLGPKLESALHQLVPWGRPSS
jgi:hypothetical protein